MSLRLVDLFPTKGTFSPGEPVRLMAAVDADGSAEGTLRVQIFHLTERVKVFEIPFIVEEGNNSIPVDFEIPSIEPRGYGVRAELVTGGGEGGNPLETAFDVLDSWTGHPRYGFLTDFAPNREDLDQTIANLARFHLNGLQFYDWAYRHNQLLPPSERYLDPLGRELSVDTIRDFIRAAHEHGMAAMPYLAVYAASLDFWEDHPGWRLLDEAGDPLCFEDFLGIMDPSPGSPWVEHLLGECERALAALEFDGLHIDQYGEPRVGFSVAGEEVDLPSAFHDFIVDARARFSEVALTFNAVRNWPIEALAAAPLDFNYIEIWPSTPTYGDLRRIVLESRLKSADKPVVVALYLPADRESNIRLADALIFASGGCRIELGEGERLLTDPYFPNHQAVPAGLSEILRRYYAFAVRYGEWMGPSALDVHGLGVTVPEGIWSVVRESSGWLLLHLINLRGLGAPRWDEALPAPEPLGEVSVEIATPEPIQGVWWASPDGESLGLHPVEWGSDEGSLVVELPRLAYWTMLAVQLEDVE